MPYSEFTLDNLEERFNVKNQVIDLFDVIQPVSISSWLQQALEVAQELPIKSEKARSESIVFPILVELRNINDKFFTIHSGDVFTAAPELDLDGECDFILAKDMHTFNISVPIFQLVEAKKMIQNWE